MIEDDPTHSKLASLVLESDGHSVNAIEAAEQAFSAIKQNRPDVILLDLNLPFVDGLTLARKLNADPEFSAISIVVLTSYPDRFTRKDALTAGCESYITKPINTSTFARLVGEIAEVNPTNIQMRIA